MPGRISGTCLVCTENESKYRCPTCSLTYCSLPCSKKHQEQCKTSSVKIKVEDDAKGGQPMLEDVVEQPVLKPAPPLLRFTDEEEEKDRVKRATLATLRDSDHLKNMLANKHLRSMLSEIDNSQEPGKHLEAAMQFPIFTEFVNECMRLVDT